MILCDPFACNTLVLSIMRNLQELLSQDALPRVSLPAERNPVTGTSDQFVLVSDGADRTAHSQPPGGSNPRADLNSPSHFKSLKPAKFVMLGGVLEQLCHHIRSCTSVKIAPKL